MVVNKRDGSGERRKTISPAEQHRDFVKAARELGTDESEEAFDKLLKRIASAPPPKTVLKRKRAERKTKA
jgi:hypothetical protein